MEHPEAMNQPGAPRARWGWWVAALGLCAITLLGWRLFWFLTDDAYITFRYAGNSLAGHGYTWNPPPFRPVEGYTSFAWLVLLEKIWRVFRVPPPQSANWISLAFAYGTLIVTALMGLRMNLLGSARSARNLLLLIALAGIVTNRTFLAWTSSGLETAMFNFLVTAWVFLMLFGGRKRRIWVFSIFLVTGLTCLTRPEGILFLLGTVLAVAVGMRSGFPALRDLPFAGPALLVPIHFLWRKAYYGEWLPNTYYAKVIGAWPESGARYLLSFVMEYSLWIWLLLAVLGLLKMLRDRTRVSARHLIVFGVLVAHFCYYTFIVGGDHFEYRVYSHLIPLLFVSAIWLIDRAVSARWAAVSILVAFVLLSCPIPWIHWAKTHDLTRRKETRRLICPVAHHFPPLFRSYVGLFDDVQHWLIKHSVCRRHQEHKVFHRYQLEMYPSREWGENIAWESRPVYAVRSVGVPGWVLPNVAVIDLFGLNDYVIARSPHRFWDSETRVMAHERAPPPGYVECFRPNVEMLSTGVVRVRERTDPLTDGDIVRFEDAWWRRKRGRTAR